MSKLNLKFATVLFTLTLFAFGCQKNAILDETKDTSVSNNSYLLPEILKSIEVDNGLLSFENQHDLLDKTNILEKETSKRIVKYMKDNNLSAGQFNDKVDAGEFNPFEVFETFESYYSLNSLRKVLKEKEDKWLLSENFEALENPTLYPISTKGSFIANENGEYIIGGSIFRVEESGVVYEVKKLDFDALQQIRSGNINLKSKNVIVRQKAAVNQDIDRGSCKAYVRKTATKYSGNHRMDMTLFVGWEGYGSEAKAKTQAYRKKRTWRHTYWGREWTSMSAQVVLTDFDIHCSQQHSYNSGKKYRSLAYDVSAHIYGTGLGLRAKSGSFYGTFSTGHVSAMNIIY